MMKKNNKKAMYDMVKKMNRGGGPIIGRIKPKDMEKVTPIGPKPIVNTAANEAMLNEPGIRVSSSNVGLKKKKRRRKNKKAEDGMKMKSYKAGGAVKPDFIDIDGDGNKEESMKEAAKGNNQAYKGMKIKKAKGGMKVYNNGGKDEKPKKRTRRPGTVPDRDKDRRFLFSRRNAAALRDQKIEESKAKMEAGEQPGRRGSEAGIAVEEKDQAKLERKAARRKAIGKRIRKRSNRRGPVARALTRSGQRRMRRLGKKVTDLKAQNVGALIESEGK